MSQMCEQASRFIDGELGDREANEFREHLADCGACQEETEAALVLSFLVDEADAISELDSASDNAGPVARARPWWRRRFVWLAAPGLIAAAAALILLVGRGAPKDSVAVAVEFERSLAPTRSIEARLTYAGADKYREYDVPRAQSRNVESIASAVLAELEESTDSKAALAAAYSLMGAMELAEKTLAETDNSAQTLADRAAIALIDRDPESALLYAARAVELDATHGPALWNRALALAKLYLPLAAANAFDKVADLGETGWSAEASNRAKVLRGDYAREKSIWQKGFDLLNKLGVGGDFPPDEVIETYPDLVRLGFYEAVRSSADGSRLVELEGFATRLDRLLPRQGDFSFVDFVGRVRSGNSAARAGLAKRYRAVRGSFGTEIDVKLVNDAKRAQQNDIALGALFWEGRLDDGAKAAYLRLGSEAGDEWLRLLSIERVVREDIERSAFLRAIGNARAALASCDARFRFRCIRLKFWLGLALAYSGDPAAAQPIADSGFADARGTNDWVMETRFLSVLSEIASAQDDVTASQFELLRAFLDEQLLRNPGCEFEAYAAERLANSYLNQRRIEAAREQLAALDKNCPEHPDSLGRLYLDSHLVEGADAVSSLLVRLTAVAKEQGRVSERAFAAHIAGRALLPTDAGAAEKSLLDAIELATTERGKNTMARRARGFSYALLAEKAGARGDFARVIELVADEMGQKPAPCSLAASSESMLVVAATNSSGDAVGELIPNGKAIPDSVVEHIRGCKQVDVYARPPFLGRAVLPASIPWRFRLPSPPPPAGAKRPRHLIVSAPESPSELDLPVLRSSPKRNADIHLRGPAATPKRVTAELQKASFVEIHAHGVLNGKGHGGASIVLSPDSDGSFVLDAAAIEKLRLSNAPTVVLSACNAALAPSYHHLDFGLAGAFLATGARTVIASPDPIPDASSYVFFDSVRAQIEAGFSATEALKIARAKYPQLSSWTNNLVVFE